MSCELQEIWPSVRFFCMPPTKQRPIGRHFFCSLPVLAGQELHREHGWKSILKWFDTAAESVDTAILPFHAAEDAEADVVVRVVRVVVVAIGGLEVVVVVVPAAAPYHTVRAAIDEAPLLKVILSCRLSADLICERTLWPHRASLSSEMSPLRYCCSRAIKCFRLRFRFSLRRRINPGNTRIPRKLRP
jgi:hypothetical protein